MLLSSVLVFKNLEDFPKDLSAISTLIPLASENTPDVS